MNTTDHTNPGRSSATHTSRRTRRTPPDTMSLLGRLTPRDRTLLELLSEHRVLTTEHIARLLFPSLDRAQRRLLQLYHAHAVSRFRRPGLDGTRTSWRYTLGTSGAAVLAAMRGTDPPRPAALQTRLLRLAAHPQLEHLLGAHEIFTSLAAHARSQPDTELLAWYGERSSAQACGTLAHPDGLGLWSDHDRVLAFFLEYDSGTEPLTRVAGKLDGYADLARAGGPQLSIRDSQVQAAAGQSWVLFHLPSTQREARLRSYLGHTAALPTGGIATTCAEFIHRHSPATTVWLPLGHQQRQSLRDLAHITSHRAAGP